MYVFFLKSEEVCWSRMCSAHNWKFFWYG